MTRAGKCGPIGLGLVALLLAGCAASHGRFARIGETQRARPADCAVELHRGERPARAFVRIARLDVHLEKTHFLPSSLEEALPELKRQACLAGADAIVDVEERRSRVLETLVYHVTAIGVRFED